MEEETKIKIERGLKGVYFDRSRVCDIDGRAGALWYRGYSIHDLGLIHELKPGTDHDLR